MMENGSDEWGEEKLLQVAERNHGTFSSLGPIATIAPHRGFGCVHAEGGAHEVFFSFLFSLSKLMPIISYLTLHD